MTASLEVPTATSFRNVPAKLLEVNRKVINGYRARSGMGKVSFTHLIGYAIVRAIAEALRGLPPRRPPRPSPFTQLSGLEPLAIRPDSNFIMVGERTNVTGSRRFARLIKENDYDTALNVALQQVRHAGEGRGGHFIDRCLALGTQALLFCGRNRGLAASQTTVTLLAGMPYASTRSRLPTSTSEMSGSCSRASLAAPTVTLGPWSPPMASSAMARVVINRRLQDLSAGGTTGQSRSSTSITSRPL